jgi:hypothetical protein
MQMHQGVICSLLPQRVLNILCQRISGYWQASDKYALFAKTAMPSENLSDGLPIPSDTLLKICQRVANAPWRPVTNLYIPLLCRIIWSSSQCLPNWCIFRSGKPRGVRILGRGEQKGYWEKQRGSVCEHQGAEVDGSWHRRRVPSK